VTGDRDSRARGGRQLARVFLGYLVVYVIGFGVLWLGLRAVSGGRGGLQDFERAGLVFLFALAVAGAALRTYLSTKR
jgi:hypothetical protein